MSEERRELRTSRVERQTYHSLDEMPPEVRAQLEQYRAAAVGGQQVDCSTESIDGVARTVIRVRDASGTERVYRSLDEAPPEIRALLESLHPRVDTGVALPLGPVRPPAGLPVGPRRVGLRVRGLVPFVLAVLAVIIWALWRLRR